MKKKFLIVLGVVTLIGLTLFAFSKLTFNLPKSWDVNLLQENTNPYGLYVAHKEVGNLAGGKLKEVDKLSDLNIPAKNAKNYVVIAIGSDILFDSIAKDHLNNLAQNGGVVFLADYYDNFGSDDTKKSNIDTVNVKEEEDNILYTETASIKNDFELATKEKFKIKKKKGFEHRYFSDLKDDDIEVIGTITHGNKTYPNYIKIGVEDSKGYYLYHAEPIYFSNYYLLNEDSYFYAKSVLKEFKGKNILWYNPNKTYSGAKNTSTLRFIMSQPALKTAWIMLLVMLFLFLLFRSKREQRIIPILEKEENHTVEFAKTISSLYQESGEIKDIIEKKIDYFLYKLRKNFRIETADLTNKLFIEVVAHKANITEEEALKNFQFIKNIQNKNKPNAHDLKQVHEIIENYKLKANI
ncbi:hypothetical protein [Chishuiella changwenlii]|uniref:hypothetical protein n=1 Tax=Chishuiella changwenlii TaxID=1434701 RepID=UPI002FD8AB0A